MMNSSISTAAFIPANSQAGWMDSCPPASNWKLGSKSDSCPTAAMWTLQNVPASLAAPATSRQVRSAEVGNSHLGHARLSRLRAIRALTDCGIRFHDMNLNNTQFEDLLAEGVPVHVAARIVEERKAGAYKDWNDFLIRLFYNGTPQAGRSPDVRPADQALLRHVKGFFLPVAATGSEGPTSSPTQNDGKGGSGSSVGIGAGGSVEANAAMPMRKGPWWEWQEQGACPTSLTEGGSVDDAFPAGKSPAGHIHVSMHHQPYAHAIQSSDRGPILRRRRPG